MSGPGGPKRGRYQLQLPACPGTLLPPRWQALRLTGGQPLKRPRAAGLTELTNAHTAIQAYSAVEVRRLDEHVPHCKDTLSCIKWSTGYSPRVAALGEQLAESGVATHGRLKLGESLVPNCIASLSRKLCAKTKLPSC